MRRTRVLVADPPWRFGDKLPGPGRGAAKHYSTLSVAELCTFELPRIADDAMLFLWRVAAMPSEALAVCRAWGFVPKAEIVWVKTSSAGRLRIGMGRYVRNAHETCLVAARGRASSLVRDHSVPSVLFAPRGRHSAKPDQFYELVERLAHGPYSELFARRRRPGWQCFGDELDPCETGEGNAA